MNSEPKRAGSPRNRLLNTAGCSLAVAICAIADAFGMTGWIVGIGYILAVTASLPLRSFRRTAVLTAVAAICIVGGGVRAHLGELSPNSISRALSLAAISAVAGFVWFRRGSKTDERTLPSPADTDRLTGTATRRVILQELERRTRPSLLNDSEFALLLVDLDDFGRVDDRLGPWVGDRLLRRVSDVCSRSVRRSDTVGRVGREEFALICSGSTLEGAELIANRVRRSIRDMDMTEFALDRPMTVSIGVAGWSRASDSATDLLTLADVALCEAKHHGKNRIAIRAGRVPKLTH